MNKVKDFVNSKKGKISIAILILFLLAGALGIYSLSSSKEGSEKMKISKADTSKKSEDKNKEKDKEDKKDKEDSSKKASDKAESDKKEKKDIPSQRG